MRRRHGGRRAGAPGAFAVAIALTARASCPVGADAAGVSAAPAAVADAAPGTPVTPAGERTDPGLDPSQALERFLAASRAESIAVSLGRYMARARAEELVRHTAGFLAAPPVFGPEHRAWQPAHDALAAALRSATADWLAAHRDRVHDVVAEVYARALDAAALATATAYFETPGGRTWIDYRDKFLAEHTYGLPFVDEPEPRPALRRSMERAKAALAALPEDGEGQRVYDFNESPLGTQLLRLSNEDVADRVGNVFRAALESVVLERRDALLARVRDELGARLPPASAKTWLGTVTRRPDGALRVAVEHREPLRTLGTYVVVLEPGDPRRDDVAAAVPGLPVDAPRPLYRASDGTLSDRP